MLPDSSITTIILVILMWMPLSADIQCILKTGSIIVQVPCNLY